MGRYRPQCKTNQLTLNFEQASLPDALMSPEVAAIVHAHLPPPVLPVFGTSEPEKPKVRAWNFRDQFPAPLDDAILNGVFGDQDPTPDQIESVHVEHANELLVLLDSVAALKQAKLTGANPETGKRPRTAAARNRLVEQLEQEPGKLRAQFDDLLTAYADGFGEEAAAAFADWVRDVHENHQPRPELRSMQIDLPVPAPLPTAVARGVFGTDDNDEPIDPSEEEVHEISLQHGEQLAEIYQELDSVNERLAKQPTDREELIRHKERLTCQAQGMLAFYAEDFGETAARHLESWARHQIFD